MSTENHPNNSNWLILQDGRMGTDRQAMGLAHAMGALIITPYHFKLTWWQNLLPSQWVSKFIAPTLTKSFKTRPVGVIGAGRRASYFLLAARRAWPGIKTIQIQNPHLAAESFTHLITPLHDGVTGKNVITSLGGLHDVTNEKLAAAKETWTPLLAKFASPRVAVLIGGNNKYTKLDSNWIDNLIVKLHRLQQSGHSLWITASRRTPPELIARLQNGLSKENVFFWNGKGENPYLGFLALADFILVTADSISMISESLYTDKPVALLRVPGNNRRFTRLHDSLITGGYTHWFDGGWHITQRPRLQETQRVAKLLLQ